MTKPLPGSMRSQLNASDPVIDALPEEEKDRLRMQAEAIRDAYPMPDIRIAQFLGEVASGLRPLSQYGDGGNLDEFSPEDRLSSLKASVSAYCDNLVALASVVSRRARGKAEL